MYGTRRAARRSAKNARREREPWLLATSAALSHFSAEGIVALYRQRMGIEQSFRDTKNLRAGLGLEVARSRSAQRLNILLLLVHLAAFVQRLIGESAKARQLELQFSATQRQNRREISVLTLARAVAVKINTPDICLLMCVGPHTLRNAGYTVPSGDLGSMTLEKVIGAQK
ncbi:MAG: transposase [Betaproteobacteria bacterium]